MSSTRKESLERKVELEKRLRAIKADIASGLAADSAEQAIELENMEVLMEINRLAEQELAALNVELDATIKGED